MAIDEEAVSRMRHGAARRVEYLEVAIRTRGPGADTPARRTTGTNEWIGLRTSIRFSRVVLLVVAILVGVGGCAPSNGGNDVELPRVSMLGKDFKLDGRSPMDDEERGDGGSGWPRSSDASFDCGDGVSIAPTGMVVDRRWKLHVVRRHRISVADQPLEDTVLATNELMSHDSAHGTIMCISTVSYNFHGCVIPGWVHSFDDHELVYHAYGDPRCKIVLRRDAGLIEVSVDGDPRGLLDCGVHGGVEGSFDGRSEARGAVGTSGSCAASIRRFERSFASREEPSDAR